MRTTENNMSVHSEFVVYNQTQTGCHALAFSLAKPTKLKLHKIEYRQATESIVCKLSTIFIFPSAQFLVQENVIFPCTWSRKNGKKNGNLKVFHVFEL